MSKDNPHVPPAGYDREVMAHEELREELADALDLTAGLSLIVGAPVTSGLSIATDDATVAHRGLLRALEEGLHIREGLRALLAERARHADVIETLRGELDVEGGLESILDSNAAGVVTADQPAADPSPEDTTGSGSPDVQDSVGAEGLTGQSIEPQAQRTAAAAGEASSGEASSEAVTILVAGAIAGDARAWEALVLRYSALLRTVVRHYRLSETDTNDVIRTVWLRMLEHLEELRRPGQLPAWLATTARRESLRLLAHRRRDVPLEADELSGSDERFVEDTASRLEQAERHEALRAGLSELPETQRQLLGLLLDDPPLPYSEISRRLGIPVGSIGPTRARAMERLRQTRAMAPYSAGLEYVGTPPGQ
jgi:RNA polymerase sigma factor (sigma-70 family)